MLSWIESFFVFAPTSGTVEWLPPPSDRVIDVWLQDVAGARIHAWWCPPPGWRAEHGAVLHCHGNAGNLSHRADAVREWNRRRPEAVLIFDYPGYGKSSGRPTERGCYSAALAAYQWVLGQGVAAGSILLYGGSLGAAIAVELATRVDHRALVLMCPFTSIPDMAQVIYPWLPVRRIIRNRFDSLSKISRCPRPVFIAHGGRDELVPFVQGERLFSAAPEPKAFLPLPLESHYPIPAAQFHERLEAFLTETARTAADAPFVTSAPG